MIGSSWCIAGGKSNCSAGQQHVQDRCGNHSASLDFVIGGNFKDRENDAVMFRTG